MIQYITQEVWAYIPGFKCRYAVSTYGRVYSHLNNKMLVPWVRDSYGYLSVSLRLDGKTYTKRIHQLVLLTFAGPPPELDSEGCHLDDNPANNWVGNLQWGTHLFNMQDKTEKGRHHNTAKDCCKYSHLLQLPNLVPSQLSKGNRNCLACDRARSVKRRAECVGIEFDFEREANRQYILIMKNHVTTAV